MHVRFPSLPSLPFPSLRVGSGGWGDGEWRVGVEVSYIESTHSAEAEGNEFSILPTHPAAVNCPVCTVIHAQSLLQTSRQPSTNHSSARPPKKYYRKRDNLATGILRDCHRPINLQP